MVGANKNNYLRGNRSTVKCGLVFYESDCLLTIAIKNTMRTLNEIKSSRLRSGLF